MLKKKYSLLWLIFVLLIIVSSCCTDPQIVYVEPEPPVLPAMPDSVILVESSPVNEYRLMVLDLQWRRRDAFIRNMLGVITQEEYEEEAAEYQRLQDAYDEAFRKYQERINLLD